ncbi:MAG: OB-fold nucleic acid binding domain-containing protein, partial [Dehalococcoidia bacterium]
ASAVAECHRLGIPVLPPDVNHSTLDFAIEQRGDGSQGIRFGLSAIKNVGAGAVQPILDAREEGGPFKSVEDLCRRADLRGLNRRALECLIKVGALDSLGDRGALLGGIDRILSTSQREWEMKSSGQSTMFDLLGDTVPTPLPALQLEASEVSTREKLIWEKELLGTFLSESPISRARRDAPNGAVTLCSEITPEMDRQQVLVVGQVSSFRTGVTRRGDPYCAAVLEDMGGTVEVVAWSEVFQRTEELWADGNILVVEGKVRVRNDRVNVVCDSVRQYEQPSEEPQKEQATPVDAGPVAQTDDEETDTPGADRGPLLVWLKVVETGDEAEDLQRLKAAISLAREHPGGDRVLLEIREAQMKVRLEMPHLSIGYSQELHHRMASLLGEEGVVVEKAR